MAEFNGMPSEDKLPEETPAPAPGAYPPPVEGAVGDAAYGRTERRRSKNIARQRKKSALLLAAAGITLCGVIYTAPINPEAALKAPAETTAAEPVSEPEPTLPVLISLEPTLLQPTEAASAELTVAERLIAIGTWKNRAESEWVHFNADGTGWWYDGTWFGRMTWEVDTDGGVTYDAAMAYLGPERKHSYDFAPEKEGDSLHIANSGGSIVLRRDEDSFTCPGLRFGDGAYLPDDSVIDASVMDGICGKTAAELFSGTVWHMTETSNLGIPFAPSAEGGKPELYTDLVYVQSIDFAAGTLCLATRDDGLLWREDWSVIGDSIYGDAADTLDISFTFGDGEDRSKASFDISVDITFGFFSDLHPGDVEYNNMHFLWGRKIGPQPTDVYLLITSDGIRLGKDGVDLFPDNYTLLAMD